MANIHIYKNNPTAGGTDGALVSEGTGNAPIIFGPLMSDESEESDPVKLAVRCDTGFETVGNATLHLSGTNAAKFALAPDSGGSPGTWLDWGATMIIASTITAVNTVFWVKAKATPGETTANDKSVSIHLTAITSEIM